MVAMKTAQHHHKMTAQNKEQEGRRSPNSGRSKLVNESPTQQPLPVSNQQIQGERLGEQVSWLLLGVDPMKTKGGVVPAGVLHEVKIPVHCCALCCVVL